MNKLLQTMLVSAVLATGGFASSNHLPQTIEAGATAYINKDTCITGTINNYGSIDTQLIETPYPNIVGYGATIKNYTGQSLVKADDSILIDNSVTNVTKAYQIDSFEGTINPNINIASEVSVETVPTGNLDFTTLSATDIVYTGSSVANQSFAINGPNAGTYNTINCHFGDQGSTNSYKMKLSGFLNINSDLSNYKNGEIEITKDVENQHVTLQVKNLYAPTKVNAHAAISNTNIYGTVTVTNDASMDIWGTTVLKSGAVLNIGEVTTSAE